MKKESKKLIFGMVVGLILGGVLGYLLAGVINPHSNFKKEIDFPNDFQINEDVENEINLFFDSSPTDAEIESYCSENIMYCTHYCREINSEHEICSEIKMSPEGIGDFSK